VLFLHAINNALYSKSFFIALAVVALFGCKEHTLISTKVSPVSDTVVLTTDTFFTCLTRTYLANDLITSTNISGLPVFAAIGNHQDSFMGTTDASVFFNVIPPTSGLSFDTSWHFDSVFLWMPYSDYSYGDTSNKSLTHYYQVYYLGDTLGYNSLYYANSNKPISTGAALSEPFAVNPYSLRDSVNVGGRNRRPSMRVKLKLSDVLPLITSAIERSSDSSNQLTAFTQYFNGLCVRPAKSNLYSSLLPYFRLDGSGMYNEAAIHLYYHRVGTTTNTPLEFYFFKGTCAHFNRIIKSYSRYPLERLIKSTQPNSDVIALQDQPGASIDLKVYGFNKRIPPNALLNKVQIQISLLDGLSSSKYQVPDQIFAFGVGNGTYPVGISAGEEYFIEDRKPITSTSPYDILDGQSHLHQYGSTPITTYTIGIPRELMANIRAANDTLRLRISGSQLFYGSGRMIAAGGSHPDPRYRAKMIVVYSTLNR
jgi:hypothetical protein